MNTSDVTKAFEGVFVAILLIAIFTTAFGILALGETGPSNEPITSFEHLEVRPEGAAQDFGQSPPMKKTSLHTQSCSSTTAVQLQKMQRPLPPTACAL
ncbi:MAG: hypothetical protein IJ978_01440 [Clostridia bacterium]|nr:hypothetical protein [Clostridia bacterium]